MCGLLLFNSASFGDDLTEVCRLMQRAKKATKVKESTPEGQQKRLPMRIYEIENLCFS